MEESTRSAPKRFNDVKLRGSGSFGEVYSAFDNLHNKWVAIKIFKRLKTTDGIAAQPLREISILKRLGAHKNVCSMVDIINQDDWANRGLLLVMQLEDCDLESWLGANNPTSSEAKFIISQVLNGCRYLHQNRIMHRFITLSCRKVMLY